MNSLTIKVLCFVLLFAGASVVDAQAKVDCIACVDFMNDALNTLFKVIVDGGIIGSCKELCDNLPDGPETDVCDIICSLVGVREFEKVINSTDPDPIYICDELNLCAHSANGKVIINGTTVTPKSGPEDTKFYIDLDYTVINTTSTGQVIMDIFPPQNFPMSGSVLIEGQAPGFYTSSWDIVTQGSDEPYTPGTYNVTFLICGGDCTNIHKYGGVYAQVNASFVITPKK